MIDPRTCKREIIDLEQNSDEWHEWRHGVLGASDGYRAMNMSEALFKEKTSADRSSFTNERMEHGHKHESDARFLHGLDAGMKFIPLCMQRGFIAASLDGHNEANRRTLEIKAPGEKAHLEHKKGIISPVYFHQCQQGMFVSGADLCDFVSYYVPEEGDPEIICIPIERDNAYIKDMVPRLCEFWSRVQTREWPDEEKSVQSLAKDISGPLAPAIVQKGIPQELSERAMELTTAAKNLMVVDPQSAEDAADIVKGCRSIFKKLDNARKEITEPHRSFVTTVNNLFKKVTDEITESGKALNARLEKYAQEQERIRQEKIRKEEEEAQRKLEAKRRKLEEAERKRREEAVKLSQEERIQAEKAAKEERDRLEAEAKEDALRRAQEANRKHATRGMAATASTRKRWVFEVKAKSKVPSKYMVVDAKAVNEAIRNGEREIAGLRIYQEESTVVR